MRSKIILVVVLGCAVGAWGVGGARGAGKDGAPAVKLEVPGVFSMDAPAAGYAWRALQPYDAKKGGQYLSEANGKPGRVVLQIDPRHSGNENVRVATLKTHFNTLVQTLKNNGYKDLKGEAPKYTPPIPDDVSYTVAGTTPTGQGRFFNGHTLFGNHTYFLQAISTTLKDAEQLGSVSKSLKEPKDKSQVDQ